MDEARKSILSYLSLKSCYDSLSCFIIYIYVANFLLLQVKTSMTTYPSSAEIISEPLGAVLVISTWNYPFCMLVLFLVVLHVLYFFS